MFLIRKLFESIKIYVNEMKAGRKFSVNDVGMWKSCFRHFRQKKKTEPFTQQFTHI